MIKQGIDEITSQAGLSYACSSVLLMSFNCMVWPNVCYDWGCIGC